MSSTTESDPRQRKQRAVVLILLAILLISASVFFGNHKDADIIVVTLPSGNQIEAEVADTPEKLLFGLAFREELPEGSGMLYIFEASGPHRVRTKGYRIPVDMIWVDEYRHIVHLVEHAEPCAEDPCPFYGPPPEHARYILQATAGLIRREHLQTGAELKFALRL
ncbi:MAG TPA: DUF192 domain-containing protein [Nitrospiraceae bacterium]|jgi:hypothetical protein|nr:DUF192 domain-containing protein [Nitrospiraceae bacterium]